MGVELRIDNPETVAMASELAELLGANLEDAVTQALRDRLAREREVQRRTSDIMAAAARLRAQLAQPLPGSDHSWLYDENGLPT